jgi:single-stranded-DNA-specific exonuclease
VDWLGSDSAEMPRPTSRFRWILPELFEPAASLVRAADAHGISPRVLGILASRGHRDEDALAALFDDPVRGLHDPRLLPGAGAFKERIGMARERAERVLVFGDFDADGLTGLAILVRALRALGLDTDPYVPDRVAEGHGLSRPAIDRCLAEDRTLIVTVDCGTSSVEEVAAAAAQGVDVLVTDHHRPPQRLPLAAAIVNPHLPGTRYPFPHLAGSGVAFKVAQWLLEESPGGREAALAMADFAAIGSIADIVPLTGENRAIVRLGLARLRVDPRPAFAALLRQAGVAPDRVDPGVVAYGLAPRLNAVGRIGHARAAVELLLTDDPGEADAHAADLQAANLVRRDLTTAALAEATELVALDPGTPAIVIVGDWPVGIIGLVAGRLVEEHGRPAVVVTRAAHPWRGSARAPAGFDLAEAFVACADLFQRHGGHAAAAGCSLLPDRYPELRERILRLAATLPAPDPAPALRLDLVCEAGAVGYDLYRELLGLEGTGEEQALIGIHGLTVGRVRETEGGHLQITLRRGREVLDGISFGGAERLAGSLHEGRAIDVAARLASRSFGGFDSLQLEVHDVAPPGGLHSRMRAA